MTPNSAEGKAKVGGQSEAKSEARPWAPNEAQVTRGLDSSLELKRRRRLGTYIERGERRGFGLPWSWRGDVGMSPNKDGGKAQVWFHPVFEGDTQACPTREAEGRRGFDSSLELEGRHGLGPLDREMRLGLGALL